MDKNVSGVDLDELLKARQELNAERGIETDPNMYNDYNPNRENEEKQEAKPEISEDAISLDNSYENNTEESSRDVVSDENENVSDSQTQEESSDISDDSLVAETPEPEIEDKKEDIIESSATEPVEENTVTQNKNLDKFDAFAAFEVKENASHHSEDYLEKIYENYKKEKIGG